MKIVVVSLISFVVIFIIIRRKNSNTTPSVPTPATAAPVTPRKPYESMGCFKDTGDRAIPTAEGTDPLLDGNHY